MGPADLRRYHRLLLKKQRELSSALGEAESRVPAAGGLEGDLIDQANADEEASCRFTCIKLRASCKSNRRGTRSDQEAHLRSVRSVRTSHFKSPIARRPLGTPLP